MLSLAVYAGPHQRLRGKDNHSEDRHKQGKAGCVLGIAEVTPRVELRPSWRHEGPGAQSCGEWLRLSITGAGRFSGL